ncbi:uncharacterized protein LOC143880668 [Tasmannia lanceolata]|uniref:uncharacterized protein LOC143880668 n=1 Tax=Tasmannia lanceolata TaxID=3420 RepID=UPI004064709D
MSGGVGPIGTDIGLSKEDLQQEHPNSDIGTQNPYSYRRFLTFRQLNALTIIIVFAASGMVSPEDFGFTFFSILYVFFMSKFAFPTLNKMPDPLFFGEKNRFLSLYVWIGAIIGLFIPIAYIFEGILEGDKEGIKAAAPHVFLLSSQVFMEGVTFSQRFSLPIRVFVPIFYNAKRTFTIVAWLRSEIGKVDEEFGSWRRLHIGRGLAVANLVFWSFNLFGFLLPVYLPRALKRYYGYKVKD